MSWHTIVGSSGAHGAEKCLLIPLQGGANLAVPLRPDKGGGGQVPGRGAGLESGGAQEHGLVELRRAALPYAAPQPEADQVSSLVVFIPTVEYKCFGKVLSNWNGFF